ncbi:surface lipoprotein assembly modifier [Necropsobacter massiliensis]|uniref:surface lipoprotein assembly modifier n=1 Tax=Necropsobacter massiliensis TaxID=1400001 RepID=UPI00059600BE|nr:surface lipoprotein assembly modifier [Necropsobacter massiliensis]
MVYQAPWWGGQLTLRYTDRHFEGKHYLYGYKRRDKEHQAIASLWHEKISWKGILPKLNLKWQHIDSNIPDFYSRTNKAIFITLEKRF